MTYRSGDLSHWPVTLPVDMSHLPNGDRKALSSLVTSMSLIDRIFLEQVGQLSLSDDDQAVFDRKKPTTLYPADLTDEEWRQATEGSRRDEFLSPFTVIERDAFGALIPKPYNWCYRDLDRLECFLRNALRSARDPSMQEFLLGRADAARNNNWTESDAYWVKMSRSSFEVIIGPYEEEQERGIKRLFAGMIGVQIPSENDKFSLLEVTAGEFDEVLSERLLLPRVSDHTAFSVVNQIASGGRARYTTVPMASNLPNGAEFHRKYGSKKTFFLNVIKSKFDLMTAEIGRRILEPEDLEWCLSFEAFMEFLRRHEVAHGFCLRNSLPVFGKPGQALEEVKATQLGLQSLYFDVARGLVPRGFADQVVMTRFVDLPRSVRFGKDTIHGIAACIEYNWFANHGAVWFGGEDGSKLCFNPKNFEQSIDTLVDALAHTAKSNDYAVAKSFVDEWGGLNYGLNVVVAHKLGGIPVDIDPTFKITWNRKIG